MTDDGPSAPEGTQLWYVYKLLREAGCTWSGQGEDWTCPAHDDENASLGIGESEDGKVLVYCQAGCHGREVLAALGTTWAQVLAHEPGNGSDVPAPDAPRARKGRPIEEVAAERGGLTGKTRYPYRLPNGNLARTVVRYDFADGTKEIRQRINDRSPCLFRQNLVTDAISRGLPIHVMEGEKAADAFNAFAAGRAVATSAPGGAGRWSKAHGRLLSGARKVTVWADNDAPGLKHAADVVDSLAVPVRVVRSITDGKGDDFVEHLAHCRSQGLSATETMRAAVPVELDQPGPSDAPTADAGGKNGASGASGDEDGTEGEVDEGRCATDRVWPSPNQPLKVARKIVEASSIGGFPTIHHWHDEWFVWGDGYYSSVEKVAFEGLIADMLDGHTYMTAAAVPEEVPWNPTPSRVANVCAMLSGIDSVYIHNTTTPGTVLSNEQKRDVLAFKDEVLDLGGSYGVRHLPATPDYFNTHALPYSYEEDATCPRWLQFLEETWPDDTESRDLLQEWFGYVLTADTSAQRFLALYGAPGTGKSTIHTVLVELLGPSSVRSVTLASLGSRFGRFGLDRAKLAVVADARWSGKENDAVVETILSLTGGDHFLIEKKRVDEYQTFPSARLMIVANSRPSMRDTEGALMRRMMLLETRNVPEPGKVDTHLLDKLRAEIPGIVNWAIAGLRRLRKQDMKFTVPASTVAEKQRIAFAQSWAHEFVEERCELDADAWVSSRDLCDAVREWRSECGETFVLSDKAIWAGMHGAYMNEIKLDRRGTPQVRAYVGLRLRKRSLKVVGS